MGIGKGSIRVPARRWIHPLRRWWGGRMIPAAEREEAAMDPRAHAMQRLQAKRRFQRHALIYAVVIGLLWSSGP